MYSVHIINCSHHFGLIVPGVDQLAPFILFSVSSDVTFVTRLSVSSIVTVTVVIEEVFLVVFVYKGLNLTETQWMNFKLLLTGLWWSVHDSCSSYWSRQSTNQNVLDHHLHWRLIFIDVIYPYTNWCICTLLVYLYLQALLILTHKK